MSFPTTNGGRLLKRGDLRDPDCARTSHRLGVGQSILKGLGIDPLPLKHREDCGIDGPAGFCTCGANRTRDYEPWVTGEMFDLAYRLADEVQTERGAYHRSQASAAKREEVAS